VSAARPDVIPETCGDCVHFMLTPVVGKRKTGCGFYGEKVAAGSTCIASRMEREDEEIEERLEAKRKSMERRLLDGPPELRRYLREARGASRGRLNAILAVGVCAFGFLMPVAFSRLGRGATGWAYCVGVAALVLGSLAVPVLLLAAALVYGVGWIHANRILSRIERAGRFRLEELDRGIPGREDTSEERALIVQKVFGGSAGTAALDSRGGTGT